ncbi:MAG: PIG-L family deacetylase [Candidatus Marinimicrobia bacterium]|nr:PIG-L family deacetylase [Candidatus Neomarinimicrobiota bacterium]
MNSNKYHKILAIGAHPDDIEIGCGGTLAKLADQGYNVSFFVVTDGSAGGDFNTRRQEQLKAVQLVKKAHLYWGEYKDTEILINKEMILKFETIIHLVEPDLIFVNYPDDTHQDHRHLAQITISATRYIKNVLFYETPTSQNFQPDVYVDIGDYYLEQKHGLLKAHTSQVNKTNVANISIIDIATSNAMFRGTQSRVKFAEAFKPSRFFLE